MERTHVGNLWSAQSIGENVLEDRSNLDSVNWVSALEVDVCKLIKHLLRTVYTTRRVSLLYTRLWAQLNPRRSHEVRTASQRLAAIGFNVDVSWLAEIVLMGLPEHYEPMIMGLDASRKENAELNIQTAGRYDETSSFSRGSEIYQQWWHLATLVWHLNEFTHPGLRVRYQLSHVSRVNLVNISPPTLREIKEVVKCMKSGRLRWQFGWSISTI